ncbi:hypothetical protein AJ80_03671 [Polytolypa hystricis UAMH7299]|uniref:Intradiol ring-cleavage dioxygenases domain-containing protein n=1 Tax=Polytolypa hystricis (strain UAMH7299) TaxID=1447883 RepID=A0A2B7YGE1_POLH7|nr:hypothetical protein AJ80_03671 [Polytolypa hystricis UAMH7299]
MSNSVSQKESGLGPAFTQSVINAIGPNTSPRMRTVMASFIQHIHSFARDVDLTVEEWTAGVDMINWAGQMSNDRRNEGQLMCDIIGLESLVDDITCRLAGEANDVATQSAILGPFFRHDTPLSQKGESLIKTPPADGEPAYVYGTILDSVTKEPVANATIHAWEASTNGLYEQQDPEQAEFNLRGKFETGPDGTYAFYCLRPTPYPIPDDGPAGQLLKLLDRHPNRPAHIHFIVLRDGYKPITTQIFDSKSKYLEDDSVFAVKDSLVVNFNPREGDPQAKCELKYDILLVPTPAEKK